MNETKAVLTAQLERAFSEGGFAELGVADLRAAADVSLRTLYKYFPSRDDMVLAALQHRHERYLAFLFDDLPKSPRARLDLIFDRIGDWMRRNSPKGCLFHNALAAQPHSKALRKMLLRHKTEVGAHLADALGLEAEEAALSLLHEGAIQSWVFQGEEAIRVAKDLARDLLKRQR